MQPLKCKTVTTPRSQTGWDERKGAKLEDVCKKCLLLNKHLLHQIQARLVNWGWGLIKEGCSTWNCDENYILEIVSGFPLGSINLIDFLSACAHSIYLNWHIPLWTLMVSPCLLILHTVSDWTPQCIWCQDYKVYSNDKNQPKSYHVRGTRDIGACG